MHKKISLLKRISKEIHPQSKIVIGVVGTHSGIGVTHLCLMLAWYYSQGIGFNTAYIECYPKNEIKNLKELYNGKSNERYEDEPSFILNGITFYEHAKGSVISDVYNDNFQCIILDMGTDILKRKSEFLRCNQKIVMSSLSPWKLEGLEKFIKHTENMKSIHQWIYLVPYGQYKLKQTKLLKLPGKVYGVPYEPDPFKLQWETFEFFNHIML
jgi:hypothetical protein